MAARFDGGSATGTTTLNIANTGGGGALTTGDGILVADAINGGATDAGAFSLGGRAAAGAYEYSLHRSGAAEADDWFLRSTRVPAAPGPTDGGTDTDLPDYRVEVPVSMAVPGLAARLGLGMLGTHQLRMDGQAAQQGLNAASTHGMSPDQPDEFWCKDSEGKTADGRKFRCRPTPAQQSVHQAASQFQPVVWARVFGGAGSVNDSREGVTIASLDRFENYGASCDYTMGGLQAGADAFHVINEDGSEDAAGLYLGFARIKGDVSAAYGGEAGETSMNSYVVGGYWSHTRENGWFRLKNDAAATLGQFSLGAQATLTSNISIFAAGDYNISLSGADSESWSGRVGAKVKW